MTAVVGTDSQMLWHQNRNSLRTLPTIQLKRLRNHTLNLKIGLLTPYTGGNLGDGAIQEAVIQNIRNRCPRVEIYGITLDPQSTEKRHNIPCFPISVFSTPSYTVSSSHGNIGVNGNKDEKIDLYGKIGMVAKRIPLVFPLLKFIRSGISFVLNEMLHIIKGYYLLKKLDFLVVCGGGQIDDLWGGAWGHPYALFKWAMISKVTRTTLIFLSVGTCSLDTRLSRFFIKTSLSIAAYRSYRDQTSKRLLEKMRFTQNDPVFPDLGFSLRVSGHQKFPKPKASRPIVGVSPIAYCDPRGWPKKDINLYKEHITKVASFVMWLIRREYRVLIFKTDGPDRRAIKDIKDILLANISLNLDHHIIEPHILTVDDLLSQFSMIDFVIASRLHGIMLSHLMNIPAIAISYDRKVDTYMGDIGQLEYCLDIHRFDLNSLIAAFKLLEERYEYIKDKTMATVADYSNSLNIQYDHIFGLHGKTLN